MALCAVVQNVDVKLKPVNLDELEQLQAWYALLNSKCVVPTLIDLDGTVVTNSKDIVHWLCNRNAEDGNQLIPASDEAYDRMMEWAERSGIFLV